MEEHHDPDTIIKVLVANKTDLKQGQIKREERQALAQKLNCKLFETSAKTGENVQKLFDEIASDMEEQ